MITFTTRRELIEHLKLLQREYKPEVENVSFHQSASEDLYYSLDSAIALMLEGAEEYKVFDDWNEFSIEKRSYYSTKWVCKEDHFRWYRCYRSKKDKKKKVFTILIFIDKDVQETTRQNECEKKNTSNVFGTKNISRYLLMLTRIFKKSKF